ncbi:hypothetical protein HJD18_13620 [Thermoleophilia bacterium SCSIO 60948]|nr:hypothetical protein HJD18_13620 [Thermoleophilia bacterium SCSIO 60948]
MSQDLTPIVPLVAASVGLLGAFVTLWVNGDRAERKRRRELRARALESVLAYREMPFMVRRRRCEPEERSAERVRLSSRLSAIQAELATCEQLIAADGNPRVVNEYSRLVATARSTAGGETHEAWKVEPISADSEVNMPELYGRLDPLNEAIEDFRARIEWANRSRRSKVRNWRQRP